MSKSALRQRGSGILSVIEEELPLEYYISILKNGRELNELFCSFLIYALKENEYLHT